MGLFNILNKDKENEKSGNAQNGKSIVIYFSRAGENYMENGIRDVEKGNTEIAAEIIGNITGAKLFKVETVKEYSHSYYECCDEAKEELNSSARPALKEELESIDEYDTVYILSPIWWGHIVMALYTQLEKLDFNGKTVKFLITHEGSGLGNCPSDIEKLCTGANIKRGLAVRGCKVNEARQEIESWIKE